MPDVTFCISSDRLLRFQKLFPGVFWTSWKKEAYWQSLQVKSSVSIDKSEIWKSDAFLKRKKGMWSTSSVTLEGSIQTSYHYRLVDSVDKSQNESNILENASKTSWNILSFTPKLEISEQIKRYWKQFLFVQKSSFTAPRVSTCKASKHVKYKPYNTLESKTGTKKYSKNYTSSDGNVEGKKRKKKKHQREISKT